MKLEFYQSLFITTFRLSAKKLKVIKFVDWVKRDISELSERGVTL